MPKKAAAATTRQRRMSDEHKAALAEGREQGRVVRRYLEALESHRPKRGRKRTPDSIAKRLAAIDEQLGTADALNRLHLVQERLDLEHCLRRPRLDERHAEGLPPFRPRVVRLSRPSDSVRPAPDPRRGERSMPAAGGARQ